MQQNNRLREPLSGYFNGIALLGIRHKAQGTRHK